jgi:SAM-dependent methyltransferase
MMVVARKHERRSEVRRPEDVFRSLERDGHLVPEDYRNWWLNYLGTHRQHFLELLALVEGSAGAPDQVVDVGNFPGHFSVLLDELGYRVVGVDLKPERAGALWQKYGLKVHKADIEVDSLPLESCVADVVVLAEVLEHLRVNPLHALKECHRILRAGGCLILSVPNVSPRHRIRFFLGRDYQGDIVQEFESLESLGHMGHYRLLSHREVAAVLGYAKFSVREMRVAGWLPGGRWTFVKFFGPMRNTFRSHLYVVAEKTAGESP